MAINITTGKVQLNKQTTTVDNFFQPFFDSFKKAYPWTNLEELETVKVNNGTSSTKSNLFQFSDNCFLDLQLAGTNSGYSQCITKIVIILGTVQIQVLDLTNINQNFVKQSWSLVSTNNGLAISCHLESSSSSLLDYYNEPDYTIFVGHVTINGEKKWGCVYSPTDKGSTYNCFSEDNDTQVDIQNIGSHTNSVNDFTTLYPIVNHATGAVFDDIYLIQSSSLSNCPVMVGGKKFIFGHRIALLDE